MALTGDMKSAMKETGLSDEFLDSPKEVMQATLAYLDATWGSPKACVFKCRVFEYLYRLCVWCVCVCV